MKPFGIHTGLVAPLDRANVDTDQLVPKQFLKRIERSGFGEYLFYNWRFHADGSLRKEFSLNHPEFTGATILVSGPNFGSGSSREHAVWALLDYGFRVVIAPSFADIFYNNSFKNGLLPVALPEPVVTEILKMASGCPCQLTVDLESCRVTNATGELSICFDVDPFRRHCLLNGLDDIDLTLHHEDQIRTYEERRSAE